MIVRVRNNTGLWRVELNTPSNDTSRLTIQDVLTSIQQSRPNVVYTKPLSLDVACTQPINTHQSLLEQNITHGSMIYCMVDPSTTVDVSTSQNSAPTTETAQNSREGSVPTPTSSSSSSTTAVAAATSKTMRRVIDKDGTIKLVPTNDTSSTGDKGFRKGMLALRDMKMHWTLSDFMLLDAQYEFKIQRQESAICQQVSLDIPSVSNFQLYVQQFAFAQKRIGYLYGRFVPVTEPVSATKNTGGSNGTGTSTDSSTTPKMKCIVEAIYEPSQEADVNAADGFVLHDDNEEEENVVAQVASMLGLERVGWIFGHEYRKDYTLSSAEIIMAAEFQLEAADGINETPFVTVTVAPSSATNNSQVSVEAFQVSQQCMAMVAEEALEIDPLDPKICVVNETFTAIQEGKASPTVENSFFLAVVPIVQHTSDTFVAEFPQLNRAIYEKNIIPSTDAMKHHLSKSGTAGWTFVDRLADFNLLIFLSKFLDVATDYPKICASIIDRNNTPLDDGYKLIIKSLAGMDGSY